MGLSDYELALDSFNRCSNKAEKVDPVNLWIFLLGSWCINLDGLIAENGRFAKILSKQPQTVS